MNVAAKPEPVPKWEWEVDGVKWRLCKHCRKNKFVKDGKRVYCSPTCSNAMRLQRLRSYRKKIRGVKVNRPKKPCRNEECRLWFVPKHGNEHYCCDECRAMGIIQSSRSSYERKTKQKRLMVKEAKDIGIEPKAEKRKHDKKTFEQIVEARRKAKANQTGD